MKRIIILGAVVLGTTVVAAFAAATPAQKAMLDQYVALIKVTDPAFKAFSPERGQAFFNAHHGTGKPDTPSCTACHTSDIGKPGRTRAGKEIGPMAASLAPARYTDPANVEKWFRRNCGDVLGRECTLAEKGDVLAYLLSL